MDFGRAIRIMRAARGYSQKELADRAGLTASFVSLLESGGRTPSMKTLRQLAEAFDAPVELIMLLAGDEKSLKNLSVEEGQQLGARLLRLLVAARDEIQ